jgi:hypothetical protein
MPNAIECTLCESRTTTYLFKVEGYDYHHCPECDLVFVRPGQRLDPDTEKSRYDQHENSPDDPHYREFLSQIFDPLVNKLDSGSHGLDFGSGPGPALSVMFREAGHTMNLYDPFYAPDASVLNESCDFITMTETAEHLFRPGIEFNRLWKLLRPGGHFGVMTKFRPPIDKFKSWHYRRDDTHVAFYSESTFRWLARRWNAELELYNNRVAIFTKPE